MLINHLIFVIYTQILGKLKRSEIQKIITGKTINLVSNDAQKFERLVYCIHLSCFAPIDILGSCILLFLLIGWRALLGVSFYIVILFFISKMSTETGKLRNKTAAATDRRLELMNEIVAGIRTVKMYAWEWNFTRAIKELRR